MCSCCRLQPPFQPWVSFAFSALYIERGQKFKGGVIISSRGSPCAQRDATWIQSSLLTSFPSNKRSWAKHLDHVMKLIRVSHRKQTRQDFGGWGMIFSSLLGWPERARFYLVVFDKGNCLCMYIGLSVLEHKSGEEEQRHRKALGLLWETVKLGQEHWHRDIQGLIKNELFCWTAVLIFKWWTHLALYLSNLSCVFPELSTRLYKFHVHSIF